MEDKKLYLFELEYRWVEGEHYSCILATTKEQKEIEKDLREAVNSIKIGKKEIDCLPTAFDKILGFLMRKGYIKCYFVQDPLYKVEENCIKKGKKIIDVYEVCQRKEKTEWKRLKNTRNPVKT